MKINKPKTKQCIKANNIIKSLERENLFLKEKNKILKDIRTTEFDFIFLGFYIGLIFSAILFTFFK